ncbi:MAG: hypothetical protein AAF402_14905 [Pseudomonadota bacterium]
MSDFDDFFDDDPEWWDPYSCQPYKLKAAEKPRIQFANLFEYLKVAGVNLALLPAIIYRYNTLRPITDRKHMADFTGISIAADHASPEQLIELVEELGAKNLLFRVKSWQTHRTQLERYAKFFEGFKGFDLTINILQSPASVDNPTAWRNQVRDTIDAFLPVCRRFQIGNAVNRSKWGCRHSGMALGLFESAQSVVEEYDGIDILGSSIIDFEPLLTTRTLINWRRYNMQACASQLYINRRGSPSGKQYRFFDLKRKIQLIAAINSLSAKTSAPFWITENNWPLLNTKPYTPNSGHPRSTVDEETQAQYLREYFSIARDSRLVERCYWWQLINPGFGLIDHRSGVLRRMPAFHAFKELIAEG